MRYAIFIVIFLFFPPSVVLAESKYVTEIRDIMFRTGPGTQYRITNAIKTGAQVEYISESEDGEWAQIRLQNGKEGWVLNHFLQGTPPSGILLAELQTKHQELSAKAEKLAQDNSSLETKLSEMTQELQQHQKTIETLSASYDTLKKESADFIALQADYNKTKSSYKEQKEKADKLENELATLYNDKRLKWFIAGAGVLVFGIIIGFVTKPQRRRSKLI